MEPRTNKKRGPLYLSIWLLALLGPKRQSLAGLLGPKRQSLANLACERDSECEDRVGSGSECRGGACSNPFESGCLQRRLPSWRKKRVCNSEDPANAEELGLCRKSPFDYMEIRIASQSWESVFFESWILQIILSELLDVPTTLETGSPDKHLNLYDPRMPFDYGSLNEFEGLERSTRLVDCRLANRDPENYESCSHFTPENWNTQTEWVRELEANGTLEQPQAMGVLGQEGWFVTKFTASRHPSLMSFLGFQGEKNRRKVAETFKRPTKWKDYCSLISPDNCSTPNTVAQRKPKGDKESNLYFADNLYTGFFRMADENNCDANPMTCTGHIMDYPCHWSSFVEQQTYHLDIPLASNGDQPGSSSYSYSEMVQIISAANATKSDLITMWWYPNPIFQNSVGTDAELVKIALPLTTKECVEARVTPEDRCSENVTLRRGDPLGSCDDSPTQVQKFISTALFEGTNGPSIPKGRKSPAYSVVKRFTINELQLSEIFDSWKRQSASPRAALCDWVVENLDYVLELQPSTYPRALQGETLWSWMFASLILGIIAAVLVIWAGWQVFKQRNRRVIRFAQIEFLWLILVGLLSISVGAIVMAVPPSDGTCVAAIWLVTFGYALEMVPLIVKVAAINRLMHASHYCRRVVLQRRTLFGAVVLICGLVGVFLIIWTALDPQLRNDEYLLTESMTEDGETIVVKYHYCSSLSNIWLFAAYGLNSILFLTATILAIQTRNLRQDFNESQTLAIMIYSHVIFLVLLVITFFLSWVVSDSILTRCRSLIHSVDTIATIFIYFVPKFLTADQTSFRRFGLNIGRLPRTSNVARTSKDDSAEELSPTTAEAINRSPNLEVDNLPRRSNSNTMVDVQGSTSNEKGLPSKCSDQNDQEAIISDGVAIPLKDSTSRLSHTTLIQRCRRCGQVSVLEPVGGINDNLTSVHGPCPTGTQASEFSADKEADLADLESSRRKLMTRKSWPS